MRMRKAKRKRLETKGWKFGTVKDFLGLSDEESAYIDLKIKLATALRQRRQQKGLSQLDLAAKLQSSQSRVAKMEAGDPSASLDLLIRSLIGLAASKRELSRIVVTPRAAQPGTLTRAEWGSSKTGLYIESAFCEENGHDRSRKEDDREESRSFIRV